jgi:hypothetical protein
VSWLSITGYLAIVVIVKVGLSALREHQAIRLMRDKLIESVRLDVARATSRLR